MGVSIAMATYNGRPYLGDQLDSILAQTRKPDEILVADDGSDDGTQTLLREYADSNDCITLDLHGKGLGVQKNFERALSQTTCKYVGLADQDDVWLKQKVEKELRVLEQTDAQLAFHNSTVTDEQLAPKTTLWDCTRYEPDPGLHKEWPFVEKLIAGNMIQGATMLFDAELLDDALPLPDVFPHDYFLALVGIFRSHLYEINEELLRYRQHDDNYTGAGLPDGVWKEIIEAFYGRNYDFNTKLVNQVAMEWDTLLSEIDRFDSETVRFQFPSIKAELRARYQYQQRRAILYSNASRIEKTIAWLKNLSRRQYRKYDWPRWAIMDILQLWSPY